MLEYSMLMDIGVPLPVAVAITAVVIIVMQVFQSRSAVRNQAITQEDKQSENMQLEVKQLGWTSLSSKNGLPCEATAKELRASTPTKSPICRRPSYRILEEASEEHIAAEGYTRRGQLWACHASWHLPVAPRDTTFVQKSTPSTALDAPILADRITTPDGRSARQLASREALLSDTKRYEELLQYLSQYNNHSGRKKGESSSTCTNNSNNNNSDFDVSLEGIGTDGAVGSSTLEGEANNEGPIGCITDLLKIHLVDKHRGFLPHNDPLQRLPYARYHIWEDLGDDLPKLLGARLGQARDPLRQLPVLSPDLLQTDEELRRAHLLLCLFAHAYVWGGTSPMDHIPEGIAVPLWEISAKLGIPPVLGHVSIVLHNWRRLDIEADICMENLSTLNNFFDGRDESWFYLITVEIEAKGARAILPLMRCIDAIHRLRHLLFPSCSGSSSSGDSSSRGNSSISNSSSSGSNDSKRNVIYGEKEIATQSAQPRSVNRESAIALRAAVVCFVAQQLRVVASAIQEMCLSLECMREGCHPFVFYHRVRPFLSAWKHNPTLPEGVIYQGVSSERQQFYGGSAAQSPLIPFLDIGLGISHDSIKSRDFLYAMREYMLRPHRDFLVHLQTIACVKDFVTECVADLQDPVFCNPVSSNPESPPPETSPPLFSPLTPDQRAEVEDLAEAYNECVTNLKNFRSGHINLVADYIMAQQKHKKPANKNSLEGTAGGKGTGGTDLMKFLKPIRDNCAANVIKTATEGAMQSNVAAGFAASSSSTGSSVAAASSALAPVVASTTVLLPATGPMRDLAQGTPVSTITVTLSSSSPSPSHSHSLATIATSIANTTATATSTPATTATATGVAGVDGAGAAETSPMNDFVYFKDNGCIEDIDLYRGASSYAFEDPLLPAARMPLPCAFSGQ